MKDPEEFHIPQADIPSDDEIEADIHLENEAVRAFLERIFAERARQRLVDNLLRAQAIRRQSPLDTPN